MSTKTTFKRVALVAVAALGLGTAVVAPANAALIYVEGSFSRAAFVAPTSTGSINSEATAIFNLGGACSNAGASGGDTIIVQQTYYVAIVSAPSTSNLAANSVFSKPDGANDYDTTVPTGYTQVNGTAFTIGSQDFGTGQDYAARVMGECTNNSTAMSVFAKIRFTPDKAGTYVIAAIPADNSASRATATWTVTVAAKAAASSTSTTSVASPANAGGGDDTDGVYGPMAANTTNIASIAVTASNGATTGALSNSDALAKSATISGPGLMSWDGGTTKGRAVSSLKGTLAQTLLVYGDGTAGKATITITDGGFTKTETIVFYGSVATVTMKANETVLPLAGNPNANNGDITNTVGAAKITVTDANGSPVPGQNVYLVSSDRAVYDLNYTLAGATDATGSITVDMNGGLTAGSFTVTATTNASSTATTGKTASAVSFRVSDGKPTLVKLTINGSSAAELAKTSRWTSIVTLSNAAGVLPKGCYNVATNSTTTPNAEGTFNAIFPGVAGGQFGMWWSEQVCVEKDGSYRSADNSYYLAESSGPAVRVTGGKTGITFDIATLTVSGDAAVSAAQDAAAEATDAANAATDAANAAAEAADAATAAAQDAADAVAALSVQVSEMVDALKKQITALTNLVIKIQKKVKA